MTTEARLFRNSIPYTMLADGVTYADPVHVPTYAAVRAMTVTPPIISVGGRLTDGDGAGGHFLLDATSTLDDDGSSLKPATLPVRYHRIKPKSELRGEWYGIKADGQRITGSVTAGSAVFTADSPVFVPADTGKTMVVDTASHIAAGTISTTAGSTIATTAGANLTVDLPIVGGGGGVGQPASGGCIYSDGRYLVVQYVDNGTGQLTLTLPAASTDATKPFYVETQMVVTITYVSATTVTMSATATISETTRPAFFYTDDTAALKSAIDGLFATGASELLLSGGLIGCSFGTGNLFWTGKGNATIRGPLVTRCCIVDGRKASFEIPYPQPQDSYSALNFISAPNMHMQSIDFDGNVPVFSMIHSAGGVVNAGGGRGGFAIRDDGSGRSSFVDCGSQGYGARDEHLVSSGVFDFFEFLSCLCPQTNNAAINVNGWPRFLRISKCSLGGGLLFGADSYLVDDFFIQGFAGVGAGITTTPRGSGVISNGRITGYTYASGAIDVFGSTHPTDASLQITNVKFDGVTGLYYSGLIGAISIKDYGGHVYIAGCTFSNCVSLAAGGRFVTVSGVDTGSVVIGANDLRGGGSLMTTGYRVDPTCPAGTVFFLPGTTFDSTITTKWDLGSEVAFSVDRVHQFEKITDPAAPAANQVKFYEKDNGSGKGQLVARFPTGAVQVIATEP